jgi:CRP/FNR family transcriptional regulator, cyclic AMP receptor protein
MAQSTSMTADLLGKTAFFGPLEHADRLAIARQMAKTEFQPNETVFARGDAGRDVYLVVAGCVRLSVFSADGRLLSFKHANPGDVFGEIAALDKGRRSADAVALTSVVAMTLAQDELEKIIVSNPRVAHAAIAWLCRRLRDTSEQVKTIALHPVEVRLARYLLSRLAPFDRDPADGAERCGATATIEPGLSQSEIASLIGASRQKVNAALGFLEQAGAISRKGRRIACDPALLVQIANPD